MTRRAGTPIGSLRCAPLPPTQVAVPAPVQAETPEQPAQETLRTAEQVAAAAWRRTCSPMEVENA